MGQVSYEITVSSFPDGPSQPCRLTVQLREEHWELLTPGSPRGPDVVVPLREDVERWLRERCGQWLDEVWYCTFRFASDEAFAAFMDLIGEPVPAQAR